MSIATATQSLLRNWADTTCYFCSEGSARAFETDPRRLDRVLEILLDRLQAARLPGYHQVGQQMQQMPAHRPLHKLDCHSKPAVLAG